MRFLHTHYISMAADAKINGDRCKKKYDYYIAFAAKHIVGALLRKHSLLRQFSIKKNNN